MTHLTTTDKELLAAIVAQLRACGYECEAGPLENNLAFKQLERLARGEEKKHRLIPLLRMIEYGEEMEKLSNEELAQLLVERVWGELTIGTAEESFVSEIIDRLSTASAQHEQLQQRYDALAAELAAMRAQIDADGMLEFINGVHREHIERLQAEVERLRAEARWEPVPDGEYEHLIGRKAYIEESGGRFGVDVDEYDCNMGEWYPIPAYTTLFDNVRLCQWQPAQDTQRGGTL